MTTYDLYAAHAMGRLAGFHSEVIDFLDGGMYVEEIARLSFDLADAMMAERKKRKGHPKDDDMERRWCPVCKEWHTPLPPHLRGGGA